MKQPLMHAFQREQLQLDTRDVPRTDLLHASNQTEDQKEQRDDTPLLRRPTHHNDMPLMEKEKSRDLLGHEIHRPSAPTTTRTPTSAPGPHPPGIVQNFAKQS